MVYRKFDLHYNLARNKVTVRAPCAICERDFQLRPVTTDQWRAFQNGTGLVQDIFPDLSPNEREMLGGGICPNCWDDILGPETKTA